MQSRWIRQQHQPAWLMGVLNCTPDSFSDGTLHSSVDVMLQRAKDMLSQGANIIDVGGESTRPGATPVSLEEELHRVIPVIQALTNEGICVSIDTMKAEVMQQAIDAGVAFVNDVSALQADAKSLGVVSASGVDVCLMHMQGTPQTMQNKPKYQNVLTDVIAFFEQRVEACLQAGIQKSAIVLDPGIGFGKSLEDNLQLIANLSKIKRIFDMPILLGTSRKSFLGLMTGADVQHRETETAITSAIGIYNGADMIRVHNCVTQGKAAVIAAHLCDAKQVMSC